MSKCFMKLCTYNYADSNASFSSEDTTFTAANATNSIRSKVWTPTGYFLVNSGNNAMKIWDGSDKYVNIPDGEYTGDSLATAIQTALNSASSGWTVTYNASGAYKFKIDRTSTAILYLTDTTNAIWDTIGFTRSEDVTTTTLTANEQRNHSFEYFKVDCGTPLELSAVCLICPIDETLNLSGNASVYIQGNDLDAWDNPPFEQSLDFSDQGIFKFFDVTATDTEYRYFRLKIIDRMNPDGPEALRISYIFIGDTDDIESSNVARGFNRMIKDQSTAMTSEQGQMYFDERPSYQQFSSMAIGNVAANDRIKIENMFQEIGVREPFFFTVDPYQSVESDAALYTRYVRFSREPTFNHLFRDYYTVSLELSEVV